MKRAFTLIEILVAVAVSLIILGIISSIFWTTGKGFKETKDYSDILEEARGALALLDDYFSRWGAGVPCANNSCNIGNTIPPCNTYPPSDPMCMTINPSEIIFYANLLGLGFVVNVDVDNNRADLISCRLRSQDLYYIWNAGSVVFWDNDTNAPIVVRLQGLRPDNVDCINISTNTNGIVPNATAQAKVVDANGNEYLLNNGYVIMRVPYRIRLYISNGYLRAEKTDMATGSRSYTTLARVQNFSVTTQGRNVIMSITFVSSRDPNKTLTITRIYGR